MDKINWKETAAFLKEKLSFLRLSDDLEDYDEDDLPLEERDVSAEKDSSGGDPKTMLEIRRRRIFWTRILIAVLVVGVVGSFILYNTFHTFDDYVIAQSEEITVTSGTKYESIGKKLFRYNSDGISCISRKNQTEWSITYSMEAPICDICGTTMAVAEQQGTQVYIVNEDGLIGNFETQLPILKIRVSRQGAVAVVLQDDNVTRINLYLADGSAVASDKTTVGETGYPLDMAISPNGQKLMVSYLSVSEGVMKSRVVFYHFGAAGQKKENNIVSSAEYPETVIPDVYFTDNSRAVAVGDSGFYVFNGGDEPKEGVSVAFNEEIISVFHDDERIGFLFLNQEGEEEYRMELYNYSGKKKTSTKVDARFDDIKIENDQILMYSDKGLSAFTTSGRPRFSSAYEKEVEGFFYFGEYRKYLVITKDSFDKIRIS